MTSRSDSSNDDWRRDESQVREDVGTNGGRGRGRVWRMKSSEEEYATEEY